MKFYTNIEFNDIQEILGSEYINWSYFNNTTIFVTGATGLIGEQVIKSIICANNKYNLKISIVGLVRNREKAFKKFGKDKNLKFIVQDISNPVKYNGKVDFIIHTANSTDSKSFVDAPVETISTIVLGTKNVLEFAKEKNVKSFVYLSSMEVYGKTDFDKAESLKESDYGYIDLLSVRSSYPEGKRLAETLCFAYNKEYNLPLKIARLVQTIGAGVDYNDNRVFAQFTRNVVEGENLVLKTTGESARSYCYITDVVSALFAILERGQNGECYNVANEATNSSIKEMAEMISKEFPKSCLEFQLDEKYYPPATKLFVDTTKLKSLGWSAKVDLMEMYKRLVNNFVYYEKEYKLGTQQYLSLKSEEFLGTKEDINIVLSSDDNYAVHCAVTMASILLNADNSSNINFYILDGGISELNKEKISELKNIRDFSITYYDMNNYDLSRFPLNRKHISVATYYRLFLLSLLPESVKKIIYLDCDVIVEQDIKNLWKYDISEYLVAAVEDVTSLKQLHRLGLPEENGYFNAGVLVLNIEKLRDFDLLAKSVAYFNENESKILLQDQDILNGVLNGRCLFLPLCWNTNTQVYYRNSESSKHKYSLLDSVQAKYKPAIIHYSDRYKPWHKQLLHPLKSEYKKYIKYTSFYNKFKDIKENICDFILKIQMNFDTYQIYAFNIPLFKSFKGDVKIIKVLELPIIRREKQYGQKTVYLFNMKIYSKDLHNV